MVILKLVNGESCSIPMLCKNCMKEIKNKCKSKEDTKPRECKLIEYYLKIAQKELPPAYNIFVKYDEIYCKLFLAKNGIVVEEHTHPKAFIGEILLRKNNPEWFNEDGFVKDDVE